MVQMRYVHMTELCCLDVIEETNESSMKEKKACSFEKHSKENISI